MTVQEKSIVRLQASIVRGQIDILTGIQGLTVDQAVEIDLAVDVLKSVVSVLEAFSNDRERQAIPR